MRGCVIYDKVFLKHNLDGHPENALRLESFVRSLPDYDVPVVPSKHVSMELLYRAHSEDYVGYVREVCASGAGYLDPDTYVNADSFQSAVYAAGAVEMAVELCVDSGYDRVFCAVRPPGHHAEKGRAMGFCIFNNVAVGAYKAIELGVERVFIVDFDAHHGNGTQHIFYEDERVFYFSTHQYPFYPGTGGEEENNEHILNIPMAYGSGDSDYRFAYGRVLPEVFFRFSPDILLVSAGFDLHREDPLTGLNVTDDGVRFVVESIFDVASSTGIPVVFTLEGGYNFSVLERCGRMFWEIIKS